MTNMNAINLVTSPPSFPSPLEGEGEGEGGIKNNSANINDTLTASIIIPTHNRRDTVKRTLDSLRCQTYPPSQFEALVVADGCTDGTAEMLHSRTFPYSLRVIEQEHQGPAKARNHGASSATGQLLIFLDDDIEPAPSMVRTLASIHQQCSDCVVIGYCPPTLKDQSGYFLMTLRNWWEAMFHKMSQPGHRFTYKDMLSGNFSIRSELFRRVGGFDPAFWCHEDYELGVRLIKAGVSFFFAPEAPGYHYENTDIRRVLERKYQEGRADVLMGRGHPEIRCELPLARSGRSPSGHRSLKRNLAFKFPGLSKKLIHCLQPGLRFFEKARLYHQWHRFLDFLNDYAYWLGVAKELGGQHKLADFVQADSESGSGDHQETEIDLSLGISRAEKLLDEARPAGLRIRFGRHKIGSIPHRPGAERLRGIHLRRALATEFSLPLLKALALEGIIDIPFNLDRLLGFDRRIKKK